MRKKTAIYDRKKLLPIKVFCYSNGEFLSLVKYGDKKQEEIG
ncbi:hypothetical protein [Niallia sp. Marseille-Q9988]